MSPGLRRLIYHRDLSGLEYFEAPFDVRDFLYDYVGRVAGTQVDTLAVHLTYNLFPTRLAVETFASEMGEPVGLEGDHATWPADGGLTAASWRKLENARFMREAGIDPVELLIGACRDAGLSFFAGVRMNDAHHAQYPWHPRFWIEHPECRLGDHPEYRAEPEDEAQHARSGVDLRVPRVGVEREAHAGHLRVEVSVVHGTRHAHDQQRHLFVLLGHAALQSVGQGVFVHGGGENFPDGFFKMAVAFFGRSLVDAEIAFVFSGKGVAEGILQK